METLGSTDVICTDKTGTLTENRMTAVALWTAVGRLDLDAHESDTGPDPSNATGITLRSIADVAAGCNNARLDDTTGPVGDPTEIAVLTAARTLGADTDSHLRESRRRWQFHFDPERKLMSTIDQRDDGPPVVHTKGAPEAVLARCRCMLDCDGTVVNMDQPQRRDVEAAVNVFAAQGLRVLAFARRRLGDVEPLPHRRDAAEQGLCLVGLIAMLDPSLPGVAESVAQCRGTGIRIIAITGDHPLTAAAIAQRVGISGASPTVVSAAQFERLTERPACRADSRPSRRDLRPRLPGGQTAHRRGTAQRRARGRHDRRRGQRRPGTAPRRYRYIAMGLSGTDVAREAATMVLTDDNFSTIVTAVHAGRRIYDNVRKFIIYIFAHATPETVPFLVFALGGGLIPLPLTILQLLAFDVGSETLPALSLSREPAEPGIMGRPPRPRIERVIRGPMLVRAWLFLGAIVAALQMAGYFYVLLRAGWHLGVPVGAGAPLHHAYQQATTMTFLGMIAGQIGTAFAVRTSRASLRSVGVFSNRYLLAGIAAEIVLAAVFVYAAPLQALLGTAPLPASDLVILLPYPLIVLECRRIVALPAAALRRKAAAPHDASTTARQRIPSRRSPVGMTPLAPSARSVADAVGR